MELLLDLYKDESMVYVSQNNTRLRSYMDKDKIDNLIKTGTFEDRILISTTSIDGGINLIDRDLKHIIIDQHNPSKILQAMGRKRHIDKTDKATIYLKEYNDKNLSYISNTKKDIDERLNAWFEEDKTYFHRKYGTSLCRHNLFFTDAKGTIHVNAFSLLRNEEEYDIMEKIKAKGYKGYMEEIIGMQFEDKVVDEDIIYQQKLATLAKFHGTDEILWDLEDREELINELDFRSPNSDIYKSRKKINECIDELGLPYEIIQKRRIKDKKRYTIWEVIAK